MSKRNISDRRAATSISTGTGVLVLDGAIAGASGFHSMPLNDIFTASIYGVDANGVPTGEFEVSDCINIGQIVAADYSSGGLRRMTVEGGTLSSFGTGMSLSHHAKQLQIGPFAGDYIIGNNGANNVVRIPGVGGAAVSFSTGYSANGPTGVCQIMRGALAGDVLVSDYQVGIVYKTTSSGGVGASFGTGAVGLYGIEEITIGPFAGDFLVCNGAANTVDRMPAAGGAFVAFGTGFSLPFDVVQIQSGANRGDFLVTNTPSSTVFRLPAAGGAGVAFGTGFSTPYCLAEIKSGTYVGDFAVSGNTPSGLNRLPLAGGAAVSYGTGGNNIGLLHASGLAISRGRVYSSSNANARVNFSAGTKRIELEVPARQFQRNNRNQRLANRNPNHMG